MCLKQLQGANPARGWGQPGRLGPLGRNERLLKVVAEDRWSFGSSHSVSVRMGEHGVRELFRQPAR